MQKIKVSVIIPIYNKAKYLKKCLTDILNQTFQDFEILCINDCSTDGSLAILQELACTDGRLKVINNEVNSGAAFSRNVGIEQAVGEYVLILDADDMYDENLMKHAYEKCKRDELDVLIYDYSRINNKTGNIISYSMPMPIKQRMRDAVLSGEQVADFSFQLALAAPWQKMYRKEFLRECKLQFQTLTNSNDAYFGKIVIALAKRIGYLEECLVQYRVDVDSQISNNKKESAINFMKAAEAICNKLKTEGLFETHYKSFNTYTLSTALRHYANASDEGQKLAYPKMGEFLSKMHSKEGATAFLNHYSNWQLEDFLNKKRETQDVYNDFYYMLKYEKEKIQALKEYIQMTGRKAILWGYGANGKKFWQACQEASINLEFVVDKRYQELDSTCVKAPQCIEGLKCIVCVASASLLKGIMEDIKQYQGDIQILDVQSYFAYGFDLSECLFDLGRM